MTLTGKRSNYMIQAREAERMMQRMSDIAVECGGVLGEDAFYDEITFVDPAGTKLYEQRLLEEWAE